MSQDEEVVKGAVPEADLGGELPTLSQRMKDFFKSLFEFR